MAVGKVPKIPKDAKEKYLPLVMLGKKCTSIDPKGRPHSAELIAFEQRMKENKGNVSKKDKECIIQ